MGIVVGVPFSVQQAAEWAGAVLVGNGEHIIERVVIDSRKADDNTLFIALPGTNTHGNNFVREFLDGSSRYALVEQDFYRANKEGIEQHVHDSEGAILVVEKPLQALGLIAGAYLQQFAHQIVVAITGSVGKTTTKALVANILQQMMPTCASEGNYNSDIGVALSALRASATDRCLVFEAGTGYPGELAYISSIINPQHVLITTIGSAHIEFFGSKLAIAAEKLSLATTSARLESLFISKNDTYPPSQLKPIAHTVRYYDVEDEVTVYSKHTRLLLSLAERTIELPFIGDFHHSNIRAAIAMCRSLGCNDNHIIKGCMSLQPPHNRFEYINGDFSIISDCYNASPESFAAALANIDSIDCDGTKYAVVGSMLELGSFSEGYHTELIDVIVHSSIERAWCIGTEFEHIDFNRFASIEYSSDLNAVAQQLQNVVHKGDLIFIKGSRAHALEQIITTLCSQDSAIPANTAAVAVGGTA